MTQNNIEILEQIAQLLENLPSEQLLQQAKTSEQIEEWHSQRKGNQILAQCWRAKFITHCDALINQALDRKEIDQLKYDGIWLLVKQYKVLWDIVQLAEPDVKLVHFIMRFIVKFANSYSLQLPQIFLQIFGKILKYEYQFQSSFELFSEILTETETDRFLLCLKPYQEISISKGEDGLKQVKEIIDRGMPQGFYPLLNNIETKKLKSKFPWDSFQMSWMTMTIMVCPFAAFTKPLLKEKLHKFNKQIAEMSELGITACRKRESKTWRRPRSFAWKNGRKVYASKNGGVYREY